MNQEARKSVPRDKWQVHVPRALRKSADWQTRWASVLHEHRESGWTKEGEFKAHSKYKSLEEAEQMVVELVPHPHTNPSPTKCTTLTALLTPLLTPLLLTLLLPSLLTQLS